MMQASRNVRVLDGELPYVERGAGNRETIVMWHSLARTGRDFAALARVTLSRLSGRHKLPAIRPSCPAARPRTSVAQTSWH